MVEEDTENGGELSSLLTEGVKPHRCDGCLNHNLLHGLAGGQGGFCSKYLLPVDLVFKDLNPHMVRL